MKFLIAVVLFFAFEPRLYANQEKEIARVKAAIDKANYCNVPSDCAPAGTKCPYGCLVLVNKNEAERIKALVEKAPSNCDYDCEIDSYAACVKHKCMFAAQLGEKKKIKNKNKKQKSH